jgi:hypothetical protein
LFTRDSESYIIEDPGNGYVSVRAPLGEPGGSFFVEDDILRKALEMGHLWLYRGFMRGTWREGCCTEVSKRHVIKGSGKGHLSPVGLLGELGEGSFPRDFERQVTEGSGNRASLSLGAVWGEPRGRAPLLGTLKDA